MKAETNSLKTCLESHRFTSPRQAQVSGKFQTPGQRPELRGPSRSVSTLCAGHRGQTREPAPPHLWENSQKLPRALQNRGRAKSRASLCNALETNSGERGLGCETPSQKPGGPEPGVNECVRPRRSYGLKRADLEAQFFSSLEEQPTCDMKGSPKPWGYISISHPQASPGLTGRGG